MLMRYEAALSRLLAHASRLSPERCACSDSLGRILAADINSPMALPSFDHAAMDGYALSAAQSLRAGSEHDVSGEQAAGDSPLRSSTNTCAIMTGARLPKGLDAVVAVERTEPIEIAEDGCIQRIRLLDQLSTGHNIRRTGEDVEKGALLIASGSVLGPAQMMLLAAVGIHEVDVVRRPRVAVIATGKELVADPRQPLAEAQIYSSNAPYLVAALTQAGAQMLACEVVNDDASDYASAVQRAVLSGADMVITTGAVSMGKYDFVPDALRQLGADVLFHKVAIRPGKPLLAARLPAGPLVMALPGTPMAVAVGLRFFVAPVLRAVLGMTTESKLRAILDVSQVPKRGLRHFLRAIFQLDDLGRLHACVMPLQHPFRIAPFAAADGWVILEEEGDYPAGRLAEVLSLDPINGLSIHPAWAARGHA